jgi:endoglycosylceramidase
MDSGKRPNFAGMVRATSLVPLLLAVATLCLPAASTAKLPRLKAIPSIENGGRIVDLSGREVILRGVNVNSLGKYWNGGDIKPVLPFDRRDPARISRIGWNVVRLIVSWSKVEPEPGVFSTTYLDRVERTVKRLGDQGIYSIIDFHQDG